MELKIVHKNRKVNESGFTIIELVALVVVIGVLLALIFGAYSTVQRNQRNQERQRDIQDIYQELEAYYVQNSEYPTLSDMNNLYWMQINMKTLNKESLRDPSGSSYMLSDKPTKDSYAYQPTSSAGGSCDNIKHICAHYALTATLENSSQNTFVKSSLN